MTRVELHARAGQLFAYSGRCALITDLQGRITGAGNEGLIVDNTRVLSRHELFAADQPLRGIVASPVGGARFLAYWEARETAGVPKESIYVEMRRLLDDGMREELVVHNFSILDRAAFELALALDADFADQEETEQGKREQRADVDVSWNDAGRELCFRYRHPQLDLALALRVEAAPGAVRFADGRLRAELCLAPRESATVVLAYEPIVGGARRRPRARSFDDGHASLEPLRRRLLADAPRLVTTNETVARAWRTAIEDLATLPLGLPEGPATPAAGFPLYQQFFGRDSITIGWQALMAMPEMLRDTLRANAAWQGARTDDWRDEEPGKMLHQARWGPLSRLGVDPFSAYYGDYATTPAFLFALADYLAWTNDMATVRALLPAARRGIAWLEHGADLDGDGFIEYLMRSPRGVKNQGWKDSHDAIVDRDGRVIEPPLATCELQAYWYAGLQTMALALVVSGHLREALRLFRASLALRRRFDRAFWMPNENFYALALDPQKRMVRSITSNPGHVLASGIVPPRKARRVGARLMARDLFSGWGIRTLSSDHVAYNPFSYHRGSVWPVENGTFAFGFARYGLWAELHRLAEGMFAATDLFAGNRLPEALGGFPRDAEHPHPGIYPKSASPQGWSASMIVLLVQSLLALHPLAPLGLVVVDPHLPPWLPDLRLEGLRVGHARLDIEFRRERDGKTRHRVLHREGAVRVVRQPPPEAVGVGVRERMTALLGSLLRS